LVKGPYFYRGGEGEKKGEKKGNGRDHLPLSQIPGSAPVHCVTADRQTKNILN